VVKNKPHAILYTGSCQEKTLMVINLLHILLSSMRYTSLILLVEFFLLRHVHLFNFACTVMKIYNCILYISHTTVNKTGLQNKVRLGWCRPR
jgi:hypothetical protein